PSLATVAGRPVARIAAVARLPAFPHVARVARGGQVDDLPFARVAVAVRLALPAPDDAVRAALRRIAQQADLRLEEVGALERAAELLERLRVVLHARHGVERFPQRDVLGD